MTLDNSYLGEDEGGCESMWQSRGGRIAGGGKYSSWKIEVISYKYGINRLRLSSAKLSSGSLFTV